MGKREARWQTRQSLASASGWCGGDPRKRRLHFEPRPPVIAANPKPRRLGVFLRGQRADGNVALEGRYGRLEDRPQPIEIGLAERVVLVVVALCTAELQ